MPKSEVVRKNAYMRLSQATVRVKSKFVLVNISFSSQLLSMCTFWENN